MYNLSINSIANHGIAFFQETIYESLKNNSRRIIAVALIALSCLTALYLAYQCCCANDDYYVDPYIPYDPYIPPKPPVYETHKPTPPPSFTTPAPYVPPAYTYAAVPFSGGVLAQFKSSIDAIKPGTKSLDPSQNLSTMTEEIKSLKTLKSYWIEDSQQELKRVLNAKLFPDSIQKAIYQPATPQISQAFSVIGRALEIKNLYQHTHYVFTHGQAPQLSFANKLIKECIQHFTKHLHQPLKVPFRLPHSVTYTENADDFIKKYNATANSAYSDNSHNAEMISVDAQFWNGDQCESALDFFTQATNINLNRGDSELAKIFKSIFMTYLPNHKLCDIFADKAVKIAKQLKAESTVGVLYAICIPKEIVKDEKRNFAYHCHPFGKQCNCYPGKDRIELLEEMQNNKVFRCTIGSLTQYRLLTSRLEEEKDVRSFAINALSKAQRKSYRNQAKELVSEVAAYSRLFGLIESLDEDPSAMDLIDSLTQTLNGEYIQYLFDEKGTGNRRQGQEAWMEGLDPSVIASMMS